jgi:hypothetical protein
MTTLVDSYPASTDTWNFGNTKGVSLVLTARMLF